MNLAKKRILPVICAAVVSTVMFTSCGNKKNNDTSSKKNDISSAEKITLTTENNISPDIVDDLDTTGESDITPSMWTVTGKNGAVVTLMGSMHALKESDYPMPKELHDAYDSADILAVEADITEAGSLTFQSAMLAGMYYDDVKDELSKHLSKKAYEALDKYLDLYSLDITAYTKMRPWAVYSVVENLSLQRSDLSGDLGLDKYLLIKAHDDEKEIYEVEGMEYQFDMFTQLSDDSYSFQFEALANRTIESDIESLDKLHEAWATGDIDHIEELANEEIETDDKYAEAVSEYEKKIYIDRNQGMKEAAENFLNGDKNVLFVVGAAHYAGDNGIISLLEKDGYTVEPVKYVKDY